ncbi:MAG: hypothetical protein ACREQV_26550 [Candidatus Binatia bacterium]
MLSEYYDGGWKDYIYRGNVVAATQDAADVWHLFMVDHVNDHEKLTP